MNLLISVTKQKVSVPVVQKSKLLTVGVWIKVRVYGRAPCKGVGGRNVSDPLQLGFSSLALLHVSEWTWVWLSNK